MTDNTRLDKGAIQYWRPAFMPGLELYCGTDIARTFPRHVHGVLSISIAETGTRICETKTDKHVLTPRSVFISNFGEVHSGAIPRGQTYSCRALRIGPELLRSLVTEVTGRETEAVYFPTPLLQDGEVYRKVACLHQFFGQTGSKLAVDCLLLDVFSLLVDRYGERSPLSPRRGEEIGPIQRATAYLQDCLHENISLEKLASVAGLSPFHLCRVFEQTVGMPPHLYQVHLRLTKAAELLAGGGRIADIAAETGFFDQSHFHRSFKRKFGVTPGEYAGAENKRSLRN